MKQIARLIYSPRASPKEKNKTKNKQTIKLLYYLQPSCTSEGKKHLWNSFIVYAGVVSKLIFID